MVVGKDASDCAIAAPMVLIRAEGGPPLTLVAPTTTIGCSPRCTVPLADSDLEPIHCTLVFREGTWHLRGLRSRLGVLVNGRAVREAVLAVNDEIRLGKHRFFLRTASTSKTSADDATADRHQQIIELLSRKEAELQRREAQLAHHRGQLAAERQELVGEREQLRRLAEESARQRAELECQTQSFLAAQSNWRAEQKAQRQSLEAEQARWSQTLESQREDLLRSQQAFAEQSATERRRVERSRRLVARQYLRQRKQRQQLELVRRGLDYQRAEIDNRRKELTQAEADARLRIAHEFQGIAQMRAHADAVMKAAYIGSAETQRIRETLASELESRRRELQATLDQIDSQQRRLDDLRRRCRHYADHLLVCERATVPNELAIARRHAEVDAAEKRLAELADLLERCFAHLLLASNDLNDACVADLEKQALHRQLAVRLETLRQDLLFQSEEVPSRRDPEQEWVIAKLQADISRLEQQILEGQQATDEAQRILAAQRTLEKEFAEQRQRWEQERSAGERWQRERAAILAAQRRDLDVQKTRLDERHVMVARMAAEAERARVDAIRGRWMMLEERLAVEQLALSLSRDPAAGELVQWTLDGVRNQLAEQRAQAEQEMDALRGRLESLIDGIETERARWLAQRQLDANQELALAESRANIERLSRQLAQAREQIDAQRREVSTFAARREELTTQVERLAAALVVPEITPRLADAA